MVLSKKSFLGEFELALTFALLHLLGLSVGVLSYARSELTKALRLSAGNFPACSPPLFTLSIFVSCSRTKFITEHRSRGQYRQSGKRGT